MRLSVRACAAPMPYRAVVPPPTIRAMTPADWPAVARIYADGLATGVASFETQVPDWQEWDAAHRAAPRLVAELDGRIAGWLAVAPVSTRTCYRGVVEHSVYVDTAARGRGHWPGAPRASRLGRAARTGSGRSRRRSSPRTSRASALHEAVGFRVVGRRERIAQRDGVWHDTVLLEFRLP